MYFYFKSFNKKKIIALFFMIFAIILFLCIILTNSFNNSQAKITTSVPETNKSITVQNPKINIIANPLPQTEFQEMLKSLSDIALEYDPENHLPLCLQFIRKDKYNSKSWNMAAGTIDLDFVNYIQTNYPKLYTYDFEKNPIFDSITNSKIDFIHLCATLNSYILLGDATISRFSGWAGDLTTLMEEVILYNSNNSKSQDELLEFSENMIATSDSSKKSSFGLADMLADIDAFNLYSIYNENQNITLYNLIFNYYWNKENKIVIERKIYFKNTLENQNNKSFENIVINTISGKIGSRIIKQLMSNDCYLKYINNSEFYNKILSTCFINYFENK